MRKIVFWQTPLASANPERFWNAATEKQKNLGKLETELRIGKKRNIPNPDFSILGILSQQVCSYNEEKLNKKGFEL